MRIKILADVGEGLTLPINYNHLLTGLSALFLSSVYLHPVSKITVFT